MALAQLPHNLLGPEPVPETLPATASVYPLVPTRSFDNALTYTVPEAVAGELTVGSVVMVPLGARKQVGIVGELGVEPPAGVKLKPISSVVDANGISAELVRLAEWIADTYGSARTRALALVVPPRISAHARAASSHTGRIIQVVRSNPSIAPEAVELTARQYSVFAEVGSEWEPVSTLVQRVKTTRATISKLAELGYIELDEQGADLFVRDRPDTTWTTDTSDGTSRSQAPVLTDEQNEAIAMCESGDARNPATLLMGVTGSGKTEVYLALIERALARGKGAIVLVPEIALTPQTAGRFEQRFPDNVEVLHSALTRRQRHLAFERIRDGRRRVVVGPRSAVFAPLDQLGILVIDEEHDGSYKQESEPRYDARRVAFQRARTESALLILGSATPRLESWTGIERHARLHRRVAGGSLARVDVVDLREHGDRFPITEYLQAQIDATLRRKRKVIILHNRRGYANSLHCLTCGETVRCPHCDLALIVHGQSAGVQKLQCHQCGFSRDSPTHCTSCHAADIARMGAGTERIERDLADRFSVPVFRLDADAARGQGIARVLQQFAAEPAAILVGTQMVAKGHDFPDVELAAIIDADAARAIPDFRADERSFALAAQLAGRAGRSEATAELARVIVQTWNPDSEFIQSVQSHDIEGFLRAELSRRKELDYPPFSRLVRVVISAKSVPLVSQWAAIVADGMRELDAGAVLGPAPLIRIADRHRAHVVIKTHNARAVATALRGFVAKSENARRSTDVRIMQDVDPQSML